MLHGCGQLVHTRQFTSTWMHIIEHILKPVESAPSVLFTIGSLNFFFLVRTKQRDRFAGLSLLQARLSGTHYRPSFAVCPSVLATIDARWRRYCSRDISALSAIGLEMLCRILRYINFLFYSILFYSLCFRIEITCAILCQVHLWGHVPLPQDFLNITECVVTHTELYSP